MPSFLSVVLWCSALLRAGAGDTTSEPVFSVSVFEAPRPERASL